jgi:hypothetical protein
MVGIPSYHRVYPRMLLTIALAMALAFAWRGHVSAQSNLTVSGTLEAVSTADGTVTVATATGPVTLTVTGDTVITVNGSVSLLVHLEARIGADITIEAAPSPSGGDDVAQRVDVATPSHQGAYEGLTPGFWKNHPGVWQGYTPDQTVGSAFTLPADFGALSGDTLLQALNYDGGPDNIGMARILLRAAVAAMLNAAHPQVNYPMTEAEVIAEVDAALTTRDRAMMEVLKNKLDSFNNAGGVQSGISGNSHAGTQSSTVTIVAVNITTGTVTIAIEGQGEVTLVVTSNTLITIDGALAVLADLTGQIGAEVSVISVPGIPGVAERVDVAFPHDFVTGGGWIIGTPSGKKANFGFVAGVQHRGRNGPVLRGNVNYVDHGARMHVKSTSVTAYQGVCGTTVRRIQGQATVNGKAGFTYLLEVDDKGEPGRNDTFAIKVFEGSGALIYNASGDLGGSRPGGGNVKLHRPC